MASPGGVRKAGNKYFINLDVSILKLCYRYGNVRKLDMGGTLFPCLSTNNGLSSAFHSHTVQAKKVGVGEIRIEIKTNQVGKYNWYRNLISGND